MSDRARKLVRKIQSRTRGSWAGMLHKGNSNWVMRKSIARQIKTDRKRGKKI